MYKKICFKGTKQKIWACSHEIGKKVGVVIFSGFIFQLDNFSLENQLDYTEGLFSDTFLWKFYTESPLLVINTPHVHDRLICHTSFGDKILPKNEILNFNFMFNSFPSGFYLRWYKIYTIYAPSWCFIELWTSFKLLLFLHNLNLFL